MEPETILQAAGYIAMGIAAWPICKYVVGPIFAGTHALDTMKSITKQAFDSYQSTYSETIKQRANVASELGKEGKTGKDISDILDSTLPLPKRPDIGESSL